MRLAYGELTFFDIEIHCQKNSEKVLGSKVIAIFSKNTIFVGGGEFFRHRISMSKNSEKVGDDF